VPVFRIEVRDGAEPERLVARPAGGSHGGVAPVPGRDEMVGIRSRLTHPPEPFRCALAPGASPELLAGLSGFEPEEGERIARWESLEVEGSDGAPVQTFMVTPASRTEAGPTLLWIHGGPIGAWGDGWHWRWNALVPAAAGYTLALPNPRGSTGFGHDFIAGIWGNEWGAQCYDDLLRITETIAARPDVDGERIAAMGGSFGGYMANWIGGQSERFRCLVTHASVFDMSAFYGVTDDPGWFVLQLGANPHDDVERFERYSPHRHVNRWTTPTLVIHGEKDYRVPVSEALALFEALTLRGVDAELLVFPDENHWIQRPRNIRAWYRGVLDFLVRYLDG